MISKERDVSKQLVRLLVSMMSTDVPKSALKQVFSFIRLFTEKVPKRVDIPSIETDLSNLKDFWGGRISKRQQL